MNMFSGDSVSWLHPEIEDAIRMKCNRGKLDKCLPAKSGAMTIQDHELNSFNVHLRI